MTTLYELYNFLEKCDTETLIQQITDFSNTLTTQYGAGSKVRYLNNLNKIQDLHSVMKFQFENGFTESIITNCFQREELVVDSTVVDVELNPKPKTNPSDKYKNMDSGDIYFAGSILPYKPSYIRDLCRRRQIPYEKPKGKYVFYRTKLEEWLKQRGSDYELEMLSLGKRVKR